MNACLGSLVVTPARTRSPDARHAFESWPLMQHAARGISLREWANTTPAGCARFHHTSSAGCTEPSASPATVPFLGARATPKQQGSLVRGGCIAHSAVCLHCSTAGRPLWSSVAVLWCKLWIPFPPHLPIARTDDAQWLVSKSLEVELPSKA